MIKLENVDKYYNYHMDTEVHALKNVNPDSYTHLTLPTN